MRLDKIWLWLTLLKLKYANNFHVNLILFFAYNVKSFLFQVSPLVNFNITESFQELSRMALKRNGMERLWRSNKVLTLHELCCHSIVARTNVYNIDKLPLPDAIKANLKSYAMTNSTGLRQALNYKTLKDRKKKSRAPGLDSSGSKKMNLSRKSCVIS